MYKKVFGTPFETYAITQDIEETKEIKYFNVVEEKNKITFTLPLAEKDIVYGLGETMGGLNKRGGRYISFNTDTADHQDSNPSLYSSHNFLIIDGSIHFGVFFDTPSRVIFEIDYENSGEIKVVCETNSVNVYQMENEDSYKITREFLNAIGRCYIPPLWAFGYGQSRFGYMNEADFLEVVDGHEQNDIPLDYICMDIDYMDRFIDFTVNKKRFPDLKAFAAQLKKKGIRLVPIVDAGIKVESGNIVYEEGVAKGYFCRNKENGFFQAGVWPGMTHFTDVLNPKAREWFGNQYRFLLFSRSSYIGAGRYGGLWTGDNSSCWQHLKLNVLHMPSLNMCGFLYSGADTGGFMGDTNRELLLRWLAVSAFTPLMRNHSGKGVAKQECYVFENVEDFRDIISFRYRLLPYLYSEYMKAALTGDMFIKPLAFGYPEDEEAREVDDQLLVGGSIMMTPVLEEGATTRKVYLPEDMTMVKYNGKEFVSSVVKKGECVIEVQLNEVVFFILKDKLIPVGKDMNNSRDIDFEHLELLGDGKEYELYVDDGMTKEYSLDKIRVCKRI